MEIVRWCKPSPMATANASSQRPGYRHAKTTRTATVGRPESEGEGSPGSPAAGRGLRAAKTGLNRPNATSPRRDEKKPSTGDSNSQPPSPGNPTRSRFVYSKAREGIAKSKARGSFDATFKKVAQITAGTLEDYAKLQGISNAFAELKAERERAEKEPVCEAEDFFCLHIRVIGARGLRNADLGRWGAAGLSDPYCKVSIIGKPMWEVSTPVVFNCLNPVWDFAATLEDYQLGSPLLFSVMDKDFGQSDELLGRHLLPATQFEDFGFRGQLKLSDAGKDDSYVDVELLVEKKVRPTGPLPTSREGVLRVKVLAIRNLASCWDGPVPSSSWVTMKFGEDDFETSKVARSWHPSWDKAREQKEANFTVEDSDNVTQQTLRLEVRAVALSGATLCLGFVEEDVTSLKTNYVYKRVANVLGARRVGSGNTQIVYEVHFRSTPATIFKDLQKTAQETWVGLAGEPECRSPFQSSPFQSESEARPVPGAKAMKDVRFSIARHSRGTMRGIPRNTTNRASVRDVRSAMDPRKSLRALIAWNGRESVGTRTSGGSSIGGGAQRESMGLYGEGAGRVSLNVHMGSEVEPKRQSVTMKRKLLKGVPPSTTSLSGSAGEPGRQPRRTVTFDAPPPSDFRVRFASDELGGEDGGEDALSRFPRKSKRCSQSVRQSLLLSMVKASRESFGLAMTSRASVAKARGSMATRGSKWALERGSHAFGADEFLARLEAMQVAEQEETEDSSEETDEDGPLGSSGFASSGLDLVTEEEDDDDSAKDATFDGSPSSSAKGTNSELGASRGRGGAEDPSTSGRRGRAEDPDPSTSGRRGPKETHGTWGSEGSPISSLKQPAVGIGGSRMGTKDGDARQEEAGSSHDPQSANASSGVDSKQEVRERGPGSPGEDDHGDAAGPASEGDSHRHGEPAETPPVEEEEEEEDDLQELLAPMESEEDELTVLCRHAQAEAVFKVRTEITELKEKERRSILELQKEDSGDSVQKAKTAPAKTKSQSPKVFVESAASWGLADSPDRRREANQRHDVSEAACMHSYSDYGYDFCMADSELADADATAMSAAVSATTEALDGAGGGGDNRSGGAARELDPTSGSRLVAPDGSHAADRSLAPPPAQAAAGSPSSRSPVRPSPVPPSPVHGRRKRPAWLTYDAVGDIPRPKSASVISVLPATPSTATRTLSPRWVNGLCDGDFVTSPSQRRQHARGLTGWRHEPQQAAVLLASLAQHMEEIEIKPWSGGSPKYLPTVSRLESRVPVTLPLLADTSDERDEKGLDEVILPVTPPAHGASQVCTLRYHRYVQPVDRLPAQAKPVAALVKH